MNTDIIIRGDAVEVLATRPAGHFHCCVTSPPYFALRSYLPKDHELKPLEIGSEASPEEYIAKIVSVFHEVRRVMHPTGLLFLNMGDSYDAEGRVGHGTRLGHKQQTNTGSVLATDNLRPDVPAMKGQLLNMPHRVAEALRADGWVWRQTIVWAKPSPMPESCKGWHWTWCRVKVGPRPVDAMDGKKYVGRAEGWSPKHDGTSTASWKPCPGCAKCTPNNGLVLRKGRGRCTTAHEYIFIMGASDSYFWDSAAFVEESSQDSHGGGLAHADRYQEASGRNDGSSAMGILTATRNPRSVWTISVNEMCRLRDDLTPGQRAYVFRRIAEHNHHDT